MTVAVESIITSAPHDRRTVPSSDHLCTSLHRALKVCLNCIACNLIQQKGSVEEQAFINFSECAAVSCDKVWLCIRIAELIRCIGDSCASSGHQLGMALDSWYCPNVPKVTDYKSRCEEVSADQISSVLINLTAGPYCFWNSPNACGSIFKRWPCKTHAQGSVWQCDASSGQCWCSCSVRAWVSRVHTDFGSLYRGIKDFADTVQAQKRHLQENPHQQVICHGETAVFNYCRMRHDWCIYFTVTRLDWRLQ